MADFRLVPDERISVKERYYLHERRSVPIIGIGILPVPDIYSSCQRWDRITWMMLRQLS